DAHRQVLKSHPNALLVLVPRHPERFDDVFTLCQQQGFKTVRRTSTHAVETNTQVYLGDTMGEMLTLMGAADICFMGGSLIGDKVGGHNVLEPAMLEKVIITGPSYFNFKEIVENLLAVDGILIVPASTTLALRTTEIISQQDKYLLRALHANKWASSNQGALNRTMSLLPQSDK
ncbi:3-deoxy-D-manno-octulosonic acid transferase, partial [Vibrio parahaemolyticus]|nr:3-deoxy-D-manno-octulosonic acid transferase [Vibrio parahaemolyticus]